MLIMTTVTPRRSSSRCHHCARPGGSRSLAGALGLLAVVAGGCASVHALPPPRETTLAAFVAGASDELRVTILPEPVIQETVVVRPDGMISISLAGDVQAA